MIKAESRLYRKPGSTQGLGQGLQLCQVSPLSAGEGLGSTSLSDQDSCPCGARDSYHAGQVQISLPVCTRLVAIAPCAGVSLSALIYGKHKVA